MELSRKGRDWPFHTGMRNQFHQMKYLPPEDQPLVKRPSKILDLLQRRRLSSVYQGFSNTILPHPPTNISRRLPGPHPYQENEFLPDASSNIDSNQVPSFSSSDAENIIQPLLSPEEVERLRTNLRVSTNRLESIIETREYDYEEDSHEPPPAEGPLDLEEYLQEEEKTKRQIDEIIMVAQALREKLEREKIRRASNLNESIENYDYEPSFGEPVFVPNYSSSTSSVNVELLPSKIDIKPLEHIPRLMDLKPKIPSLMDLHVPPPPINQVIRENTLIASSKYNNNELGSSDTFWSYDEPDHRYVTQLRKYCFRCGRPGFDVRSCPDCKVKTNAIRNYVRS